ncbi:MAG: sigma 54-interacting transcriptional regulator [Firmicutes bacterium]|nr:sigma 54-interacting transcriptional regulator [Bacillota bacterium]
MTLKERFNEILNIYNYYNMAIIVNDKGTVEYFYNNRPDINSITEKEILGHNVLESCLNVTEETSTLYYAIRTGKPVKNVYYKLETSKGDTVYSYGNTIPIKDGDKVLGAVEIAKYIEAGDNFASGDIFIESFKTEKDRLYSIEDIKGSSKEIERLKFKIQRVADTDSTVLIYGETGTGKELAAESIHSAGKRKNKKFVSQNCAAIPPMLLESILFGTEKGSFTGAENRRGIIESAQGGTLFLDEINTMDVDTQSKILKAIEEKKIMRVGGTESIPVDVRVIAAVNVNPKECVRQGTLREDLYYGNVRELKNAIERGFNIAVTPIIESRDVELAGRLEKRHGNSPFFGEKRLLPDGQFFFPDGEKSLKEMVADKEREIIEKVYSQSKNVTEAAAALNVSRQGLSKKLAEYGITEKKQQ